MPSAAPLCGACENWMPGAQRQRSVADFHKGVPQSRSDGDDVVTVKANGVSPAPGPDPQPPVRRGIQGPQVMVIVCLDNDKLSCNKSCGHAGVTR